MSIGSIVNYMGETIAARFGNWFTWQLEIQKIIKFLAVISSCIAGRLSPPGEVWVIRGS